MTTTLEEATAAPTTLRFGKREFKMAPLTDEDTATLNQWVRARHMRIARQSLPKDASEEQKDRTERIALEQASKMSFMFDPGVEIISTPEGWAQIMWCCVHRRHPDITPKDIEKLIAQNPDSYKDLQKEFERLNADDVPEEKSRRKTKKKTSKKKVKKKMSKRSRRRNR